jgi:hypothetical protein
MTGFKQNSDEPADALGEVLFEFITIGNTVKVSALHVATNTEVAVVGAATMSAFTLKANALRKLRARLARGGGPDGGSGSWA